MKKVDLAEIVNALLCGAIGGIVIYFFLVLFLSLGE
jgi:hypothetical protein